MPDPPSYTIGQDSDDGTEVDGVWYGSGYAGCLDWLGRSLADTFTVGLRFAVPDLEQGESIKYARLRLAAQGGEVTSCAHLVIRGVDEDSPETFSEVRRPTVLPKTGAKVVWEIHKTWLFPGDDLALRYDSPNVAGIICEILSRPNWGTGGEGKTLGLVIEGAGCPAAETNLLMFEDYSSDVGVRDEAILEVYPTLEDAFVGKPILGRPTDTSVAVHVINLVDLDIYAEYGTTSGSYSDSTAPLLGRPGGEPIEVTITGLEPDTRYYYKIRYREHGDSAYYPGSEGGFHTQRSSGEGFDFTVQADSHILPLEYQGDDAGLRLYAQTIGNIASDQPDFHISMGDFVHIEIYGHRNVLNLSQAVGRYLKQREYLDAVLGSAPFFLVLGNHEGEQGWRVSDPSDSVTLWGTMARQMVVPNPIPDGFHSGDTVSTACCGYRGDYYSWEWGDALLVVLDPFWYTTTKPHCNGGEGSGDPWHWTLGSDQYVWLYETLHNSDAVWKFVFIHHLVGGVLSPSGMLMTPYGRGGIEAAKHAVDSRGSYEWGGENDAGSDVFACKRPGWGHGPIHDMMVDEGVTILFHGHDHVFVHQELDGIVYQTYPQPSDAGYGLGWYADSYYRLGEKCANSGHLRVKVRPNHVQVDYVRSVLPEDEPLLEDGEFIYNGEVSRSYSLGTAGVESGRAKRGRSCLLGNSPNPSRGETKIFLLLQRKSMVSLNLYDTEGRLVKMLFEGDLAGGMHEVAWARSGKVGEKVAPGLYFCRLRAGRDIDTRKILVLR